MSGSADCSATISGEHYISANILEELHTFSVSGFPWLQGETKQIGVPALTSNVLCDRHNSAFSPLDSEAGYFFGALAAAIDKASEDGSGDATTYFLTSGNALELWMMKMLAALYASGMDFAYGAHRLQKGRDAIEHIANALEATPPIPLYRLCVSTDPADHHSRIGSSSPNPISVGPILHSDGERLAGLHIALRGIGFSFFANDLLGDDMPMGTTERPDIIDFDGPKRTSRIYLAWDGGKVGGNIVSVAVARRSEPAKAP